MTHPIIIIGSGMAGYTLAREFRKLDKTSPVTLISQNDATNYAKPTLSNALAAGKTPDTIGLGDATKMAETLDVQILAHTQVTGIDTNAKTISTLSGDDTGVLSYSQLVLAVGAKPIQLTFEGDASDAVFQVNDLDDYAAFIEALNKKPQSHVAIIGAGLIGCEFANDLTGAGHKVTVLDLAKQPLGALLPDDLAHDFTRLMQAQGVDFIFNTSAKAVDSDEGAFKLSLTNGDTLTADVVLSAVGLRPDMALAQAAGIATNRGIVVDAYLQTNVSDIYAIGDCAEVVGHVLPYVMPLMNEARALAKTLAFSAIGEGERTKVSYPAMPVGVKTPAAPLVILPPPVDVSDGVAWTSESTEDGMIASAHDAAGTLRGFVLLGKAAGKLRLTLAKQVPALI